MFLYVKLLNTFFVSRCLSGWSGLLPLEKRARVQPPPAPCKGHVYHRKLYLVADVPLFVLLRGSCDHSLTQLCKPLFLWDEGGPMDTMPFFLV
ncbi:hypothetical protein KP509_04G072900 [Ceratopteris richardii]|uniref:Secreted protein n=1 Tax=Ceratopteris richardii TaxID=49495 RepID=A0A8T2V0G6_CERRI|nr:hypothetical protein KP509_04G072900 [Ceratopteris richardii]